MNPHTLDLHGLRHHEIEIKVENFIFLNTGKLNGQLIRSS